MSPDLLNVIFVVALVVAALIAWKEDYVWSILATLSLAFPVSLQMLEWKTTQVFWSICAHHAGVVMYVTTVFTCVTVFVVRELLDIGAVRTGKIAVWMVPIAVAVSLLAATTWLVFADDPWWANGAAGIGMAIAGLAGLLSAAHMRYEIRRHVGWLAREDARQLTSSLAGENTDPALRLIAA